jgi:hypothetical protein
VWDGGIKGGRTCRTSDRQREQTKEKYKFFLDNRDSKLWTHGGLGDAREEIVELSDKYFGTVRGGRTGVPPILAIDLGSTTLGRGVGRKGGGGTGSFCYAHPVHIFTYTDLRLANLRDQSYMSAAFFVSPIQFFGCG